MFVRVKNVGTYRYLQIAENRREGKRVKQTIIATLGRLDKLAASGAIDQLLRSAARFTDSLQTLNRSLWAWIEGEYHNTPHRGLEGRTPLEQWALAGAPPCATPSASPARLHNALGSDCPTRCARSTMRRRALTKASENCR